MSRLSGEKVDPRKVTGLEFQATAFARVQIAVARMKDKCGLDGSVRLIIGDRGEAHFILCRFHPETGREVERHLFDCKNYKRTLGLVRRAKFLLIGLRRLPASLNLVSATSLQPQAVHYARFFFYQHDEQPSDELEKTGGKTYFATGSPTIWSASTPRKSAALRAREREPARMFRGSSFIWIDSLNGSWRVRRITPPFRGVRERVLPDRGAMRMRARHRRCVVAFCRRLFRVARAG